MSEEDSVSIRQFFKHLYEAAEYMEQYPELRVKKATLEDRISAGLDIFLSYKINGLNLDDSLKSLLAITTKDNKDVKEIHYLCNFLIFGLLVQEGDTPSSAYTKTLAQYDTFIEKIVVKSLMKEKYFRKMNEYELKNIKTIKKYLTNTQTE